MKLRFSLFAVLIWLGLAIMGVAQAEIYNLRCIVYTNQTVGYSWSDTSSGNQTYYVGWKYETNTYYTYDSTSAKSFRVKPVIPGQRMKLAVATSKTYLSYGLNQMDFANTGSYMGGDLVTLIVQVPETSMFDERGVTITSQEFISVREGGDGFVRNPDSLSGQSVSMVANSIDSKDFYFRINYNQNYASRATEVYFTKVLRAPDGQFFVTGGDGSFSSGSSNGNQYIFGLDGLLDDCQKFCTNSWKKEGMRGGTYTFILYCNGKLTTTDTFVLYE